MKYTNDILAKLKTWGFKWCKDKSTDTVSPECIKDVIPAANGFTVLYNEQATALYASTAVVRSIEFPDNFQATWIVVEWETIVDERR